MIKFKSLLVPLVQETSLKTLLSTACKPKHLYNDKIQAWQIHDYGDLNELQLSEVRTPIITNPNDILIKVEAASLNPIDKLMIGGYGRTIFNCFRENSLELPLTLGRDFCGEILEKGHNVDQRFKIGDKVYGFIPLHKQGSHTDITIANQSHICHKPPHLNHIEAASIPYAAMTAYGGLYVAGGLIFKDKRNCRILILGASGGVGTLAVQLLKAQGATVLGTCSSDAISLLRSLGIDSLFDYHQSNYKGEIAVEEPFDVILDCCKFGVQNVPKNWKYSNFVTLNSPLMVNTDQQGLMLGLAKSAGDFFISNVPNILEGKTIRWGFFVPSSTGFQLVNKLVNKRKINPVIQKVFSFEDLPKGIEALTAGHLRGKIVIDFENH